MLASALSLAGITSVTHVRGADIGIAPFSAARAQADATSGRTYPADHDRRAVVEVPVDGRFVRRDVAVPDVRLQQPVARTSDERTIAASILAARVATYPILEGSTVEFGDTGEDPEAHVFYKSARIVISHDHTVGLERIIDHEIWHIIDWRDNGRIDWGEDIPPGNAGDYRL